MTRVLASAMHPRREGRMGSLLGIKERATATLERRTGCAYCTLGYGAV